MNELRARVWRVAIVEDHLLQRLRTEQLVNSRSELEVVFSGDAIQQFVDWLRRTPLRRRPHLVILDLHFDRRPAVDVAFVKALLTAGHRILVLSALASPNLVRQVVRAGVTTIVGKRDSEHDLMAAIRATLRGEEWTTPELAAVMASDPDRPRLSTQEERALVLYASGLPLVEVAVHMNVKPDTAKKYLSRVKDKYTAAGVPARTKLDLSRIAWRHGYLDPAE